MATSERVREMVSVVQQSVEDNPSQEECDGGGGESELGPQNENTSNGEALREDVRELEGGGGGGGEGGGGGVLVQEEADLLAMVQPESVGDEGGGVSLVQQQQDKEEEEDDEIMTETVSPLPKEIISPHSASPSTYTHAVPHSAGTEKNSSLPVATSGHTSLLTRMESVEREGRGGVGGGGDEGRDDVVVVVRTRTGR